MYEYIIPQEFNQDDRIGSFTMPQVAVIGASGLLIIFLFTIGLTYWLLVPVSFMTVVIAAILMFKKINQIPMYEFIFVYAIYVGVPRLLVYRAENVKEEFYDELDYLLFEDGEIDLEKIVVSDSKRR